MTVVMHEEDDAYSIQNTWSCYLLDQFPMLANSPHYMNFAKILNVLTGFFLYLFDSFSEC